MDFAFTVTLALAALILERALGYSQTLYRLIGHPVTWMGSLIALLDRFLNHDSEDDDKRRVAGIAALATTLAATVLACALITWLLPEGLVGTVLVAILASTLMAQKSLDEHVRAVADALDTAGKEAAREVVAKLVGRDVGSLDEAGVARAAIESLAENFSDAVVAPAFWTALFGLAGGAAYKALNTADSMIGHHTPRYAEFGWAAARCDDLANLPASRLSALWLVLAAFTLSDAAPYDAAQAVFRDAAGHRSPNAGWPEAAMAGALGLKLAGPRVYQAVAVDDAYMGDGRDEATSADIRRALALYRRACSIHIGIYALLAFLLIALG
jgi:adenosylcobinamide-phosphate synthase